MISAGGKILDIGGYSNRPGAKEVSLEEELKRTIPVINIIRRAFPEILLSIDTFRSTVARAAVESGADMVNDISGGTLDPEMLSVVGGLRVPYICMHMRGTPDTMSQLTTYENLEKDILSFF